MIYQIKDLETRWVDVREALPPQGVQIVIATSRFTVVGQYNENQGSFYSASVASTISGVTHWRLYPRNPNKVYGCETIELVKSVD